jgi:hypothetical protein
MSLSLGDVARMARQVSDSSHSSMHWRAALGLSSLIRRYCGTSNTKSAGVGNAWASVQRHPAPADAALRHGVTRQTQIYDRHVHHASVMCPFDRDRSAM